MADKSPGWKKPSKVLKVLRRKKTAGSSGDFKLPGNKDDNVKTHLDPKGGPTASQKRKNPFGFLANKRSRLEPLTSNSKDNVLTDNLEEKIQENSDSSYKSGVQLFDVLDAKDQNCSDNSTVSVVDTQRVLLNDVAMGPKATAQSSSTENKDINSQVSIQTDENSSITSASPTYPFDWSLKTKMRILSSKPFSWCCPLKSAEEANGLCRFVKCEAFHTTEAVVSEPESSTKEDVHSCCMYWMHPHLPWLRLFPRTVPDSKIGKSTSLSKDEEVLSTLQTDWSESFMSLFHQFKSRLCPYFYVCAHQFTVLFHQGAEGDMRAVLTPTTRGFRQAMHREGIEFSMPLNTSNKASDASRTGKEHKSGPESSSASVEATDGGDQKPDVSKADQQACQDNPDDDDESHEGNSEWLENLGLDKRKFRALDPNRLKLEQESWRHIDERAESVVVMSTGHDTLALFNLLLNSRSCLANKGVQAGIPPTLLAPTAFKGAALKSLQVRAGTLRQEKKGAVADSQYSLELTGPLMPVTCQRLVTLLRHTHPAASVSYSTAEDSTPLNCLATQPPDTAHCHTAHMGKEAVRQLAWNEHGFQWTIY